MSKPDPQRSPFSYGVLARTLALAILAFSGLVTLVTVGAQLWVDYQQDVSQVTERLAMIERSTVASLGESAWNADQDALQIQLDGINSLPDITGVRFVPTHGPITSAGRIVEAPELQRAWPVHHAATGELLGELQLQLTLSRIRARLQVRLLTILLTQTLKTLVVTVFILAVFHALVTRHLEVMAAWSRRLRLDGLDEPLRLPDHTPASDDELGVVVEALNTMRVNLAQEIGRLERAREAARQYVPLAFLRLLGHDQVDDAGRGDTTAVQLTMMFADIRGFTTLAESLPSEEVFAFINRHLARIEPAILREGGFINEYRGDGILALFHDPAAAIRASREVVGLGGVTDERLGEVDVRVGLHTAHVMLGVIGGARQLSAVVVGDGVNTAARIEGLTRKYGVSLLVSGDTVALADGGSGLPLRQVDRVAVKGRVTPIDLWEPVPEMDPVQLATWHTAFALYQRGAWPEARAALTALQAERRHDPILRVLLDRISTFAARPPEAWDGVYVWTEK